MENIQSNRLAYFPISLFGAIMGYSGLTLAFKKTHDLLGVSPVIYQTLTIITTGFFMMMTLMYLAKILKHPDAVRQDLAHPVMLHFFPTFSISLILLSLVFKEISHEFASILWHLGVVIHFGLLLYILNSWMHHDKWQITHMNPAWFIPVVGNILVPLGAPAFSNLELGWFFFSIGLVFWIVLFTIVMYRLFFHSALVKMLEPTLFILIAPPAVGFMSYMTLTEFTGVDHFGRVLYYMALFLTLLLLSQAVRFVKVPFALSWWAYTFPLAAVTIASLMMYQFLHLPLYAYFAVFFMSILSVLVLHLTLKTLLAILNKKLCVAPHVPANVSPAPSPK